MSRNRSEEISLNFLTTYAIILLLATIRILQ